MLVGGLAAVVAMGLTAMGIHFSLPALRSVLSVVPNARSGHRTPTPQGGGFSVVGAVLLVALSVPAFGLMVPAPDAIMVAGILGATLALGIAGAADDHLSLPVAPRLIIQGAAAVTLLAVLPADARIFTDFMPVLLERALLAVGIVGFINFTNFMDGMDGLTIAELVPVCAGAALGLLLLAAGDGAGGGYAGATADAARARWAAIVGLAVAGALIGFGWFNWHPAKIFLGDVGSLPLGFLTAWLMIELAVRGCLAAALLLPAYYLFDATATVVRRYRDGEPLGQAHRRHAYQRAFDAGRLTVPQITREVWIANIGLAALALVSIALSSRAGDAICLVLGGIVLLRLMLHLEGLNPAGRRK